MFFLFLESLGTTELLVILVVALALFGPRKLPELSRSLGKSLNEFKRAGDDFKRTWEREVALENVQREAAIDRAMVAEPTQVSAGENVAAATPTPPAHDITEAAFAPIQGANIARGARAEPPPPAVTTDAPDVMGETAAAQQQPSRKTDWL